MSIPNAASYLRDAKNEAEEYLRRSITDAEWNEALPEAQRKLDFIIGHSGDGDGERRKPRYLGMLVKETMVADAFSRSLVIKNELNKMHREMAKTSECITCGFKCLENKKERNRLISETAPITTTQLYIRPSANVNTATV